MRRPNYRNDNAPVVRGAVGETVVQGKLNSAHGATHCPVEIAQRRAASIRMQAIGQIGGA